MKRPNSVIAVARKRGGTFEEDIRKPEPIPEPIPGPAPGVRLKK